MKINSVSRRHTVFVTQADSIQCSMVMGHWDIVSIWQLKLRFIVPLGILFFYIHIFIFSSLSLSDRKATMTPNWDMGNLSVIELKIFTWLYTTPNFFNFSLT